ncbi:hypothetical protein K373_04446 [Streptomyces sp. DvalAA-21]|nr:hypothetical protein K373_04446 [Streptomyces sp. DvalAA-21]RAJ40639.1 hypothetical protein K351_00083 [Streptomyces sp. DpondAA-E10]RAJ45814.1 hypothetical protein K352_03901 [Streptomyces sp. DpondAA-A50]SCD50222.1 hypothetical protein GA0115239_102648 [Streptomyces sp. BpilaLS-43]SCE12308.1 hypothetical protein GA0115235_11214 [Streptomyces sp. DpondAA-F4a]SCL88789.1 hypothetical protein SAMN04883147_103215 [Streptomyces sp. DpondAA-F4]
MGRVGPPDRPSARTTGTAGTDEDLLPYLSRSDPRLDPVLDRLAVEHRAVRGVVDRLDRAPMAVYSTTASSRGVVFSRRPPSSVTVTMSSMRTPKRPGR